MVLMPLLLADLHAFYLEHRRCGELESEISEGEPAWIVMACSCDGHLVPKESLDC